VDLATNEGGWCIDGVDVAIRDGGHDEDGGQLAGETRHVVDVLGLARALRLALEFRNRLVDLWKLM